MELIEKKAREALDKYRAKLAKLEQQERANEITEGLKLRKQRQALQKLGKCLEIFKTADLKAEALQYSYDYRDQCTAYNNRPEATGSAETRKRLAREGLAKLCELFKDLNNREEAGQISKAKALKIKTNHLIGADWDHFFLNEEETAKLRELIEEVAKTKADREKVKKIRDRQIKEVREMFGLLQEDAGERLKILRDMLEAVKSLSYKMQKVRKLAEWTGGGIILPNAQQAKEAETQAKGLILHIRKEMKEITSAGLKIANKLKGESWKGADVSEFARIATNLEQLKKKTNAMAEEYAQTLGVKCLKS